MSLYYLYTGDFNFIKLLSFNLINFFMHKTNRTSLIYSTQIKVFLIVLRSKIKVKFQQYFSL